MYKQETRDILSYVHTKGPDGLVDVASFVLSTIQTPLVRTKPQVADIKINGSRSEALWGFKRAGYEAVEGDKRKLYSALVERSESLPWAIYTMMSFPGFGMVKGSFFLQCIGYQVGCLDSHNIKRFGLDEKTLKVSANLSVDKKMEKVYGYIDTCDRLGGAEGLWNDWCKHVASLGKQNKSLPTAEAVSRFHYEVISQQPA
jgi:hypothetical protein